MHKTQDGNMDVFMLWISYRYSAIVCNKFMILKHRPEAIGKMRYFTENPNSHTKSGVPRYLPERRLC